MSTIYAYDHTRPCGRDGCPCGIDLTAEPAQVTAGQPIGWLPGVAIAAGFLVSAVLTVLLVLAAAYPR